MCEFVVTDTRLVGIGKTESRKSHEGRLEIQLFDIWGTICLNNCDVNCTKVACYMEGYGYVSKRVLACSSPQCRVFLQSQY